jgi:hypothetical protein
MAVLLLGASAGQAPAADDPNLVGWWKLDEGSGTVANADMLVLYVRGRSGNKTVPLYVALEDSAQHVGTVVHPDSAITTAAPWTQWKIPLSSFTGVNAAKVKKLVLGVGDRQKPAAGGAGRIYLDDIRVTKP